MAAAVKRFRTVGGGHGHGHTGLAESQPAQPVGDRDARPRPGHERLLGQGAEPLGSHALVSLVLEGFDRALALVIAHRAHEENDRPRARVFHRAAHRFHVDGLARERHVHDSSAAAGHGRDPRHLVAVLERLGGGAHAALDQRRKTRQRGGQGRTLARERGAQIVERGALGKIDLEA